MGARLTERTGSAVVYIGRHTKMPGIDGASSLTVAARRDVMDRLAEYEDTGLTPEQIGKMQDRVYEAALDMLENIKALAPHLAEITAAAMQRLTDEQMMKIAQNALRKK